MSTPDRISQTQGRSDAAIHRAVAQLLSRRLPGPAAHLVDLGCGRGELRAHVEAHARRYTGVDASPHGGTWRAGEFVQADLSAPLPLQDAAADVVVAVETIEHLEHPRGFLREAVRVLAPGGLLVITTPNQESVLSLLSLVVHGEYAAFREAPGLYPAHVTALLGVDLRRMAAECGLVDLELSYTGRGRVPGTGLHWPPVLGGRRFSDNVLLSGRKR